MITFAMLLLTLLTVLGGVILGWLARCYWLGGRCCEMIASYEADGGEQGRTSLTGGSVGTAGGQSTLTRSGSGVSGEVSGGEGVGVGGIAAGALGTVAAGAAAVRAAGGKAVEAGTAAARTAGEKVSGVASDARSSISDRIDSTKSDDSGDGEGKGLGGIAAGALGTVAAGAAAVRAAGGKAVEAGTAAARTAGEKVSTVASDARSSISERIEANKSEDPGDIVEPGKAARGTDGDTLSGTTDTTRSNFAGTAGADGAASGTAKSAADVSKNAGQSGGPSGTTASVSAATNESKPLTTGGAAARHTVSGAAVDTGAGSGSTGGRGTVAGQTGSGSAAASASGGAQPQTPSSSSSGSPAGSASGGDTRASFAADTSDAVKTGSAGNAGGTAGDTGSAADGRGYVGGQTGSGSAAASASGGAQPQTPTSSSSGSPAGSASGGDTRASFAADTSDAVKTGSAGNAGNDGARTSGGGASASSPSSASGSAGASGGMSSGAGDASAQAGTDRSTSSASGGATAAAGIGGAALAGAAVSGARSSSGSEMSSPELEASRAEVRGLRKRLGLSGDSDGSDRGEKSVDAKLGASREEGRRLRQELWSKQQAEEAAAKASADARKADSQKSASGSPAADEDFGSLSAEEAEAERLLSSGSVASKPASFLSAPTPGSEPDDLTKIRGIGKPTQGRLNRNGIYYYDQIAGFTGSDLAWADQEMNLEGRVVSDRWIPQAKMLAGHSGSGTAGGSVGNSASGTGDEDDGVALVDVPSALTAEEAEAERLLESGAEIAPPTSRLEAPRSGQSPDDLTAIKGIGPKINGKLNDQGIYYYDQIAGFTGSDLAWADRELEFKGRAVRDRWIPQAKGLMAASAAAGSEPRAAAPAGLLSKPIEGRSPDDLTAIKGVGDVLQKQLNDKGIYYYSQIADFSDSDQQWADQTLGFPGRVERDNWIPQARELMSASGTGGGRAARAGVLADAERELGSMSETQELGELSGDEAEAMRLIESGNFVADESNRPAELLSSPSQGAKDDLRLINGVGPKLEDLLNSLGIYYFRQIGGFSATDIAWVDSKLRFKGRIVRDRWVDQAKRLS